MLLGRSPCYVEEMYANIRDVCRTGVFLGYTNPIERELSRENWAYLPVDIRPTREQRTRMETYERHSLATLKMRMPVPGSRRDVGYYDYQGEQHEVQPSSKCGRNPMIAFRVYPEAGTAAMNVLYQMIFGSRRANLYLDSELECGVHAYADIHEAIVKI